MYTKHAKCKQVLNVDWMGQDMMERIAMANAHKEGYDELVRADYYWIQGWAYS